MAKRLVPLAVVLLMAAVTACDTQTSLEQTPEVAPGNCPEPTYNAPDPPLTGTWGSAGPNDDRSGVEYQVNDGFTARICAGAANESHTVEVVGPASGTVEAPGNNLNHWSVPEISGGATTTSEGTTTSVSTSPTTEPSTTSIGGGSSTTLAPDEVTTTTEGGGVTTTTDGEVTTSEGSEATTTSEVAASTITAGETTTTAEGGGTVDPGEASTTTVEIGSGTLEPGQETSTTGDPGTTGEQTTTTGDEVAGESEDTLPYTGAGDMTTGGLAGMLLAAGIFLLLITRKRSGAE